MKSLVLTGLRSCLLPLLALSAMSVQADECPAVFQQDMKQLHSSKILNLCDITKGHPVLLVNTASHCGFTRQFGELEKLHEEYKDKGLVVIGVASNSFDQEAENEEEIARVCRENFGVTFTMLAPVAVTGENAHPLFKQVGDSAGYPRWNFYKYLLDKDGKVVQTWTSFGVPDEDDLKVVF
ncbi:glutathione peroxidase [Parathalassolituus penaei]|uniref:Glutathione peroxidase n=1 Tax=Parathalassolituus penaei TaxID=2997323 RepID=A0A9X3ITF8_9GAMM|nr:glutathione peroxidase [Parathalassolituus penaei]MCY0965859.1 glutathione peroxidase [Parathalassolituus penaei]